MVVQNERYDDWKSTVVQLRTMFNQYNGTVLGYHQQDDCRVPPARNSTAAEGNFLEVLNMGLNSNHVATQINASKHCVCFVWFAVYEKFYLDRNFDRTGKQSLVVTPGSGVFEVDRELTFITKQRTIDIGERLTISSA